MRSGGRLNGWSSARVQSCLRDKFRRNTKRRYHTYFRCIHPFRVVTCSLTRLITYRLELMTRAFFLQLGLCLASVAAGTSAIAQMDMPKPAYDFSLPREERIKLAEGAAPPEVSSKATVYLLDPSGYVKVREGTNGFSCFVDRNTPWNCEPMCFDPEGSATTLPARMFVEDQRAKGKSENEINKEVDEGYKSGRFKVPSKPGIVYMMSNSVFVLNETEKKIVHGPPHLMFYAPYATPKDIGSPPRAANMPIVVREGRPDAFIVVIPGPAKHDSH